MTDMWLLMCDRPYVETLQMSRVYIVASAIPPLPPFSNLIKEGEMIELTGNRITSLSICVAYSHTHCEFMHRFTCIALSDISLNKTSMEHLFWRDQPAEPMCPGGQIGQGGALIETCRRLIDVLALVSGLFQTTMLIAGFRSRRENQYGLRDQELLFAGLTLPVAYR